MKKVRNVRRGVSNGSVLWTIHARGCFEFVRALRATVGRTLADVRIYICMYTSCVLLCPGCCVLCTASLMHTGGGFFVWVKVILYINIYILYIGLFKLVIYIYLCVRARRVCASVCRCLWCCACGVRMCASVYDIKLVCVWAVWWPSDEVMLMRMVSERWYMLDCVKRGISARLGGMWAGGDCVESCKNWEGGPFECIA
jgi:hypothetical protein